MPWAFLSLHPQQYRTANHTRALPEAVVARLTRGEERVAAALRGRHPG